MYINHINYTISYEMVWEIYGLEEKTEDVSLKFIFVIIDDLWGLGEVEYNSRDMSEYLLSR